MIKTTALFLFLITLSSFRVYGQAQMNSSARLFTNQISQLKEHAKGIECYTTLADEFALTLIGGEYHIGILALIDEKNFNTAQLKSKGIHNNTQIGNLMTFRVPLSSFDSFINTPGLLYFEIGESVSPYLNRALPTARVDSVHLGLGGLSRAYTGKGVVIGVIDWGFDYTHPNFYDTTLSRLRIVRAWDQNKLSGPPPSGYSFGTEYIGESQLLAAGADTLYVFGPSSHGTHVAGIAGGSGAGTPHRGVAFESELIFVSLHRDASSLLDAFSYIANHAAAQNKPFVINMSFGSHLGPHDGSSLKNLGIDLLHGPGKVFVGSAGNNGTPTSNFHLDKDFSTAPNDTLLTLVNFANYQNSFGQTLSMWGSENSDFSVAVRLINNQDSTLHQTQFYHSNLEPLLTDTITVGSDTLIIRIQSTARHFLNNKPNIRLEIKRTGSNRILLMAASQNSHLHIWNNVRMNNRYTNWGVGLTDSYPGTVAGDNHYGLGEPAGVGKNVITVASYNAEMFHPTTGNMIAGNISQFSSQGPTVDGRTKPDIASAGEGVISSVNSFDNTQTNFSTSVNFNGKTYGYTAFSGTSMSGPLVAGIVALMLEAFPQMSAVQTKEILKATARLDQRTGQIGTEGHLKWGWGKANALAAILAAKTYSSTENIKIDESFFNIYPNPTSDIVNIEVKNSNTNLITIFSIDGKIVREERVYSVNLINLNVTDLPEGLYLIKVQSDKNFGIKKLLITRQ